MRILHLISTLDPSAGGPPMVVTRLAAAQARIGHEVHLLCYSLPRAEKEIATSLSRLPGGDLLRIEQMPPFDRFEWHTARRARARLRAFLPEKKVEVVHLHGLWDPILKAGADEARRARVPCVIAPHGMLDEWALTVKPLKKKLALALGYRAMVRGAALMHALSTYEKSCIEGGGWNPRVRVIPNGVFLDEIDPLPPRDEFARRAEVGGRPYILFLARLHEVKGLDVLVEAFASIAPKHPEACVVVAGPDFGAKAALEAQIGALGLGRRVLLVGPLWGREKFAAYAGAACFCLPSKHEGFSMSIAEALACRVPVVISENCHFPEVGETGAGFVVKREAGAVAAALDRLLGDGSLREAMGARGRQLIEERFTWERVAEESARAYATILPAPLKPSGR